MKKFLTIISLPMLALAMTCCNKDNPSDENKNNPDTPSTAVSVAATLGNVEGVEASIPAGAQASVFHAEEGSTSYTADGKFAYADGKFSGNAAKALEESKKYDWFVVYPATDATSPAKAGVNIPVSQTSGALASSLSYAGVAKGVAASQAPSVSLSPLGAVLCVSVKNSAEEAMSVQSVSVATESVDIAGEFTANLVAGTIRYTSTDASSKSVTLVAGGVQLEVGASAEFKMVVKPCTVSLGEKVTITVVGDKGEFVSVIELPQDMTIEAGKQCSVAVEKTSDVQPYLALGVKGVVGVDAARKYHVSVDCNVAWQASVNSNWVTLEVDHGEGPGEIVVSLGAFAGGPGKDEYVTVKAGNLEEGFAVSQGWGTQIDNLIWAKYDLDTPGAFTGDLEMSGKFYQWNSKAAWLGGNDYENPCPEGYPVGSVEWTEDTPDMWAPENDPCPLGWHVPTSAQARQLLGWDFDDIFHTDGYAPAVVKYDWHWGNVTQGVFVGNTDAPTATVDNLKGNIFIPMCGYRGPEDGVIRYTSSTFLQVADLSGSWYGVGRPYYQIHWNGLLYGYAGPARQGMPVRCVAEVVE